MKFRTLLVLLLCATVLATVNANLEGNALHSWRSNLADPYNVLQSWDPTLINPCTWFHVTCNNDNALIRIDLGAAGLSGILVPELGLLSKLQYMQIGSNNISGSIPKEIGKLRNLVSLGLENNQFSGTIPSSLGHLKSLKFLRLNGNQLTGHIPSKVFQLVWKGNLLEMNVSNNLLTGTHRSSTSTVTTIIQDPRTLV